MFLKPLCTAEQRQVQGLVGGPGLLLHGRWAPFSSWLPERTPGTRDVTAVAAAAGIREDFSPLFSRKQKVKPFVFREPPGYKVLSLVFLEWADS